MAAPPPPLAVQEIADVATDSFNLCYVNSAENERVLCKNVLTLLPVPRNGGSEDPGSLLLFIRSHNENNAAGPGGDSDQPKSPSSGAFVGHLVACRVPPGEAAKLSPFAISSLPEHLDLTRGRQLHVIISIKSGIHGAEDFFFHILEPLFALLGFTKETKSDSSFQVHRTSSERSILGLASNVFGPQANRGVPQTVLLLSGDGGAIDIINGISVIQRTAQYVKPVIGVLALGTGNALANSSGLNLDNTKGLSSFLRGSPRPLPTFRARFSAGTEILSNEGQSANPIPARDAAGIGTLYGVVVASWCIHASLVADSDTTELRKHGVERFGIAANELLFPSDGSEPHLYQGKVTLRQRSGGGAEYNVNWERQDHAYLLATFVSNLEKNLTISPRSQPLDGQLRILHFGKLPSKDIMSVFALAYEGGKHTELDVVGYEAVEGFRIDFTEPESRWRRVCVDGKIVRVNAGGWMEVDKVAEEFVDLVTDA